MLRITALLLISLGWTTVIAAQQPAPNDEPLRLVHFSGIDLASILAQLALDQQLPLGFEVDPKKPRSPIDLKLANVRPREVLDGLVRVEPGYQWRDGGDFLEVFPVTGRSAFLDTPVSAFDMKDVTRSQAIDQLMARPEVQAIINSIGLKPRPVAQATAQDARFSAHVEATSLRQALNQIAKASGTNFWVFRSFPGGSFSVGLTPY
jgi:type II secretory pathway component GspD/PulD (secretin)